MSDEGALRLTIVGSGTLVPSAEQVSACHHVATGDASVLLDCGSGALHRMASLGIDWSSLTHVAVSHFHYDHVGDLPALLVALQHGLPSPRSASLTLIGPAGLGDRLSAWSSALGIRFLEHAFPLGLVELEPGDIHEGPDGDFRLSAHRAAHTDESLAYRLEARGSSIGYTGDTGPSEALAVELAGVDVLLAECAHPDPSPTQLHLTPAGLGAFASVVAPELLVVTHVYPSQTPEEAVRAVSSHFGGAVRAAYDGLVVRVAGGSVTVDLPGSGG